MRRPGRTVLCVLGAFSVYVGLSDGGGLVREESAQTWNADIHGPRGGPGSLSSISRGGLTPGGRPRVFMKRRHSASESASRDGTYVNKKKCRLPASIRTPTYVEIVDPEQI